MCDVCSASYLMWLLYIYSLDENSFSVDTVGFIVTLSWAIGKLHPMTNEVCFLYKKARGQIRCSHLILSYASEVLKKS